MKKYEILTVLIFIFISVVCYISYKNNKKYKNSIQNIKNMSIYEDEEEKSNFKIADHNEDKLVIHDIKELIKEKEEKKEEYSLKKYEKPTLTLLKNQNYEIDKPYIKETQSKLEEFLKENKIEGKIVECYNSPNFVTYAISLKPGTKIDLITKKNKVLESNLKTKKVAFEIAINNTSNLGVIVRKPNKTGVYLRNILEEDKNKKEFMSIPFGIDYLNRKYYYDIKELNNIIIKGSTGSGKSVCINDIIVSILMKARPDEVKLILVDPKKVELGIYNGIPHLLTPVVTNPKKASVVLKKAVAEMERRYDLFEETKTKNIAGYNELVEEKNKKLPDDEKMAQMPYIVVIVDELADLMLVARKEVEDSIMKITQIGPATGIHLIISTFLPEKEIKLIKNNFSTTIELNNKENKLLLDIDGDMIIKNINSKINDKIQCPIVSEKEIEKVVNHTVSQQIAQYDSTFINLDSVDQDIKQNTVSEEVEEYDDPLYNEIVEFVIETQKASASLLQRRFKLGYNRAAIIIDLLEERGIIGPQNGSKPREVLVTRKTKEEKEVE